jgi:hypothetical protein
MESRRPNISILNNDDNPSFIIRSSEPSSYGRSPNPRQPLYLWPTSSSGSYTRESAVFSPSSPSFSRQVAPFSHRPPMTPSPEPNYPYPQSARSASSYGSSSMSLSYPTQSDRLSIKSITHPPPSRAEPASPESSLNGAGDGPSSKVSKKNKYPCPYAASHDCSATFTTSGHAARHGKKHTGEKSVLCPICNKAFTRKDNMKQHKRTHRSVIVDEDIRRTGSSKWAHVGGGESTSSGGMSHSRSDGRAPPTPASERSLSSRSSAGAPVFTFGSEGASRRQARGERVKRPSISSSSSSSSSSSHTANGLSGLDALVSAASRSNHSSRRRR